MNKIMLTVFSLMACVNGQVDPVCNDKYCLYYGGTVSGRNSTENARTLCSQIDGYGWLLEVYDEQVSQLVDQFVSQLKPANILLNTNVVAGEWKWINNKTFFNSSYISGEKINEKMISYIWWTSFTNKLEYYAEFSSYKSESMLCEIKQTTNCPDNGLIYNSLCYFPLHGDYSWYEAQNKCIKAGGNLAVLDNFDFTKVNQTWIANLGYRKYWVGLTRSQINWEKRDSIISMDKWKGGNRPYYLTSDQCVVVNTSDNNNWIIVKCDQNVSVVCMKNVNTTMPSDSSPNMSTPIQSAILSDGQKIGIGVGIGVFLLLLLIIGVMIVLWKKNLLCCSKFKSSNDRPKTSNVVDLGPDNYVDLKFKTQE